MTVLSWTLLFSIGGGLLSLALAVAYALLPERIHIQTMRHLVSVATGALLGAAFIGLLPEALAARPDVGPAQIMATVLGGILVFFALEKTLVWRHAHLHDHEPHAGSTLHASGYMIMVGDSCHNLLDGILIAAAFLTDIKLGIITGLAVIAHELPQELGDFVIMVNSGMTRGKALGLNALSGLATVVGALATLAAGSIVTDALPYLLAFTASGFIYVAVADLIPSLHRHTGMVDSLQQIVLITLGLMLVIGLDALGG